jgi:hypothetical protein
MLSEQLQIVGYDDAASAPYAPFGKVFAGGRTAHLGALLPGAGFPGRKGCMELFLPISVTVAPIGDVMSKEAEYRQNAADSVELAQRATSSADKGRLLALAERWLDLGDRAQKTLRSVPLKMPWIRDEDRREAE